jgi:hypothetical protein
MIHAVIFELPRPHLPGKFSFPEVDYGQMVVRTLIGAEFAEEMLKKKPANFCRPAPPLTEKQNPAIYHRPKVSF